MLPSRNTKDEVELLECPLLRLRNDEEYDDTGQNVKTSVKAKSTRRSDFGKKRGERQTQGASNCVVHADGEGCANLSMGEREGFGEVN